jgi:uncharacterized membrane protein YdjX (TVP38/TMEM64 family)
MEYLIVAGVVFAINLLPALGPPTWAVLVFFRLHSGLDAIPLVLVGAIAAAGGRLVLALLSRRFRGRLSAERIDSLEAARSAISGGRKRALAGLALFLISPLPSAQLFVAAGLMDVPLLQLTTAFFAGRLASYSIYVAAASAASHSLGSVLQKSLGSPIGIALQALTLAALIALLRVDWARVLARHAPAAEKRDGARPRP